MKDKPSPWAYITTIFLLVSFGTWAIYEYQKDTETIPFEPLIACLGSILALIGYLFWKKKFVSGESSSSKEVDQGTPDQISTPDTSPKDHEIPSPQQEDALSGSTMIQKAQKIYNINKIDKADFS